MKQKWQNTFFEILTEKDREEESVPPRSMSIGVTLRNGYNLIVPSGFQYHTLNAVLDVLEGR